MHIAGFKRSSLNEWDGHISSIIWTAGCNWKCAYCHASHLIKEPEKIENIEENTVFDYINSKDGWIDGLCISGGEPTIQPDLFDFIKRAKNKTNVDIKLETNGSNPSVIKTLLSNNLLKCLCLDLKQLPSKLLNLNGQNGGIYEVLESFNVAFGSEIEVEFHTTLCPKYIDKQSIEEMGKFLHGSGVWVLQQYKKSDVLYPDVVGGETYTDDEVNSLYECAKSHHKNVILKNI